jgi:Tol biopolymer transport system component
MTRDGKEEPVGVPSRAYLYPRISPDGSRVLLDIRDQDNDIWLLDLRRGTLTNLTRNPALDRFPVWTPDGTQYFFVSDRDGGRSAIYRQAADGSGEAVRLTEGTPGQQTPTALTPDGRQLIFDLAEQGGSPDLMTLSLDKAGVPRPLLQTPFVEVRAALSPDGRWLAYHGNESGQFEVYVRPFPMVSTAKAQASTGGGVQPWWSRNGKELFYFTPGGALMSVPVDSGPAWSAGRPTVVFENKSLLFNASGTASSTFDIMPNGQRFLMIRAKADSGQAGAATALIVVQHFDEELKRLAPAN